MTIAQTLDEMREKLKKITGEDFESLCDDCVKRYYMEWFHGGAGGCACKWEDRPSEGGCC